MAANDNCERSILDSYLASLRKNRYAYQLGLELASRFVDARGGEVSHNKADNLTTLKLGKDTAFVFQPYPDIDRFYYEL